MAQKVKTIKTRVLRSGKANSAGYSICKNCGGDGIVKKRNKKK